MIKLSKKLLKAPFTWSQARQFGLTRYQLKKLIESNQVMKVGHGVYKSTDVPDLSEEEQYKAALLQIGKPSAICLISALVYHQLTDLIPKKIWVLVETQKKSNLKNIRLSRRSNPMWRTGIESNDRLKVTSVERTLVECLHQRKNTGGAALVIASINQAISEQKTTMNKVIKMARKLKLLEKIKPYLEAISL